MSDPLARRLLELPSSSGERRHLERAALRLATPLSRLALTVEHIQAVLDLARERTHVTIPERPAANTSLQARVAVILASGLDPWLNRTEREALILVAQQVAGRDVYLEGPLQGWALQYACLLYQKATGNALEAAFTKLNYPIKQHPAAHSCVANIPEVARGRHSIVVVGLPNSGKTALCGRLVQALAGSSLRDVGRVQSAARRNSNISSSVLVNDAVWMMDRNVLERTHQKTYFAKEFPLHHPKIGSFMVVDTPHDAFGNEQDDGFATGFPRIETRRRNLLAALTMVQETDLVLICVPVQEKTWTDAALLQVVQQVRAATPWPQTKVALCITHMDRVDFDVTVLERVSQHIRKLVGESVLILPTSAAVPARGIVLPHEISARNPQERRHRPDSILSLALECMVLRKRSSDDDGDEKDSKSAVVYVLRRVRNEETCTILVAKVVQGPLVVGQLLKIQGSTFTFQLESIEWYGHPVATAYPNQIVGIRINTTFYDLEHRVLVGCQAYEEIGPRPTFFTKLLLKMNRISPKVYHRPQLVAYPNQVMIPCRGMQILQEKQMGSNGVVLAELILQGKPAQMFFLGQRFLLYRAGGKKAAFGYGMAVQVGETVLPEKQLSKAMDWLSRDLKLSKEESPPAMASLVPPPLPPAQRNVSAASTLSMGLSSLGGTISLTSGPATSINEAIRQADAAVKSMLRLKSELERAKETLDRTSRDEQETQSCYMCLRACSESSDSHLVPICSKCSSLNEEKRICNLGFGGEDSVFLVTGARIKIGYATVERLLSEDVTMLILTTRFPYQLAEKLHKEHSEHLKRTTVHIYGADFRSVGAVISLATHLAKYYPKIVALINNAAQTVRRPSSFYTVLVQRELELARVPGVLSNMVKMVGSDPYEDLTIPSEALATSQATSIPLVRTFYDCEKFRHCSSALMTQCHVMPEDAIVPVSDNENLFPLSHDGIDDTTGEGVLDLREITSWRKSILPSHDTQETVETVEFLEVLLVNTLSPFTLIRSLVRSLEAAKGNVINVSSREGVFARVKQSEHPHTNSAKAGLNMLTRTAAYELKRVNVMICSVDTGWVSKCRKTGFHPDGTPKGKSPPLTVEDAAARILDPIAQRKKDKLAGKRLRTGQFFRNFEATPFV